MGKLLQEVEWWWIVILPHPSDEFQPLDVLPHAVYAANSTPVGQCSNPLWGDVAAP
ncbi:MAG: hypothetical protein KDA96_05820 [Planctomycetaceae bacterium]|nr:hypothetical protein [Planctomycetaceae bacterium]MCA9062552.1 hypothetical protein [Planctomycetaceae bacterium]